MKDFCVPTLFVTDTVPSSSPNTIKANNELNCKHKLSR